ncbi:glycosyltransferase family 2 protein [Nocardioides immobilis]|uniref:glycosyltransferase family 2 protein n=1 Tax=Nocardioides immobilis TaxID=2049295 RepID=UPI001C71712C|nr:glycosyltransferase family 2 protein [Nocardioides immobilis]
MRDLQRAVGLLILGTAALGAALLWGSLSWTTDVVDTRPSRAVVGAWDVFYDTAVPSARMIALAAVLALVLAAGVAVLERRVSTRDRRSADHLSRPLAPKLVMAATRGVYAGPVTLTVLIPAHNEERGLRATLVSLLEQSHRPERVIVVADNCTDGTADIARSLGIEVFETIGNYRKKAGALNQVLYGLLPLLGDNDLVMVMDADTVLDDGFLESAVRRMSDDRALMAIGGLFHGEEGHGLLGQFQRNEYTRYARDLRRRRGRVFVLTGTATVFRSRALRWVAEERDSTLPGVPGDVYDTEVLTEDNEITLALKTLGALVISPSECTVVTELMPTWRSLWVQRLRWQRGALENLGAYGFRPQTLRYWAQQLGIGYGVIALATYLTFDGAHGRVVRQLGVVPLLARPGRPVHARADRERLGRRLARAAARGPAPARAAVRDVPRRRLRQGRPRHLGRPGRLVGPRGPATAQHRDGVVT